MRYSRRPVSNETSYICICIGSWFRKKPDAFDALLPQAGF
jgi:hypothetical protein